jgi:hypothetical protein
VARRTEWKKGLLRKDRQQRLKRLGFELTHRSFSWERKFEKLLAYKQRYGHCDVPTGWPKDPALAHWVITQRSWRRKGRLSQDRIQRLDGIGFSWSSRLDDNDAAGSFQEHVKVADQLWELRFAELVRFRKQYGHFSVPQSDVSKRRLHDWLAWQRKHRRSGRLREDRKRRLQKLGVEWEPRDPRWDRTFAKLMVYKKRFGHCDVLTHSGKYHCLGHWISNQRSFRRKGLLSQERIKRLDQVGFPWISPRYNGGGPKRGEVPPYAEKRWSSMFSKLERFKQQHGHLKIPWGKKTKPNLWGWLNLQRLQWRQGQLSQERRRRLKALGLPVPRQRR